MTAQREIIDFSLILETGLKSFVDLFASQVQFPFFVQSAALDNIASAMHFPIMAEIGKLGFTRSIETIHELLLNFSVLVRKAQLRPKDEAETMLRIRHYQEIVKKVGEDLVEELETVLGELEKEEEY